MWSRPILVTHLNRMVIRLGPALISLIPLLFWVERSVFAADENVLQQIHLGASFVFQAVLGELVADIACQFIVRIGVFQGVAALFKLLRRGSIFTQTNYFPSHVRLLTKLTINWHLLIQLWRSRQIPLNIIIGIKVQIHGLLRDDLFRVASLVFILIDAS